MAAGSGTERRGRRARGRAAAFVVAGGIVACVAASAVPAQAAVIWSPVVTVSKTSGLDLDGETLTVTGTGFDPLAHEGTRAPLAGKPSGFYLVFGRFGDPWRPSGGAPSSARQVITQKWALPAASRALLDPNGTSTELVTIAEDGTFSTTIDAKTADGTGAYAVATYPGSGAVDPSQETLTPVSFAAPPVDTGTGTGTGTGAGGQSLVVTPMANLNPEGQDIRVQGSGYDPAVGVYAALCVDNGPGAAPSPCVGGADQSGTNKSAAWISSNPPPYAVGLTTPFGPGGTFDVELRVRAKDELVDCYQTTTRCVLATRADHTKSADRSADVKVPVYFTGQQAPVDPEDPPAEPKPTITLGSSGVAQGGSLAVQGTGFLGDEQVQVWLHSSPQVLLVVDADAAGTVTATVTIPAETQAGVHHIELVGITSGRRVASTDLTVVAAAVEDAAAVTTTTGAPTAASSPAPVATATGTLPATGSDASGPLAGSGLALVAAGVLLVLAARRRATTPTAVGAGPFPAAGAPSPPTVHPGTPPTAASTSQQNQDRP